MVFAGRDIMIREFRENDAEQIYRIIKDCFMHIDVGGHTEEGIRLQLEANAPERLCEKAKKVRYFIAEKDNKVIGICGYDKEKIHTLFVDRKLHRQGIGNALLYKVLGQVQREALPHIFVWSTLYAVPFYENAGFTSQRQLYMPEGTHHILLIEMKKVIQAKLAVQ